MPGPSGAAHWQGPGRAYYPGHWQRRGWHAGRYSSCHSDTVSDDSSAASAGLGRQVTSRTPPAGPAACRRSPGRRAAGPASDSPGWRLSHESDSDTGRAVAGRPRGPEKPKVAPGPSPASSPVQPECQTGSLSQCLVRARGFQVTVSARPGPAASLGCHSVARARDRRRPSVGVSSSSRRAATQAAPGPLLRRRSAWPPRPRRPGPAA